MSILITVFVTIIVYVIASLGYVYSFILLLQEDGGMSMPSLLLIILSTSLIVYRKLILQFIGAHRNKNSHPDKIHEADKNMNEQLKQEDTHGTNT